VAIGNSSGGRWGEVVGGVDEVVVVVVVVCM